MTGLFYRKGVFILKSGILEPIKGLKVRQIKKVKHGPIIGLKIKPLEGLKREKLEIRGDREEGSTIISAVVILLLLVGLVAGLSSLIVNESGLSTYELNKTRAFYIAESGIEYASTVLANPDKWDRTSGELLSGELDRINTLFNTGELKGVTKTENLAEGTVTIVSTGFWRGVEKKITAVYRPGYHSGGVFSHSLVSRGKMSFYDNSQITGDGTGGDLYSNDGIYTYDHFILNNCNALEKQVEKIFPKIDLTAIRENPDKNTSLDNIGGNVTHIGSELTPLTLDTPMQINGGGIMLVDGDLTINQQIYFNSTEPFILIVRGDVYIRDISGGKGLIYSYGNLQIDDVQNFKGSLFAGGYTDEDYISALGTLVCNDAIDVTFNNEYVNMFLRYGVSVMSSNGNSIFDYKLLSWSELG